MSKLETFNTVVAFLNVIVVGLLLACIVISLASCTTPEPRGTKLIKRACVETSIETHTPESWSDRDQAAYDVANKRCRELYLNSPCLKRFIRMEQGRYRAVCGGLDESFMFEVHE